VFVYSNTVASTRAVWRCKNDRPSAVVDKHACHSTAEGQCRHTLITHSLLITRLHLLINY